MVFLFDDIKFSTDKVDRAESAATSTSCQDCCLVPAHSNALLGGCPSVHLCSSLEQSLFSVGSISGLNEMIAGGRDQMCCQGLPRIPFLH